MRVNDAATLFKSLNIRDGKAEHQTGGDLAVLRIWNDFEIQSRFEFEAVKFIGNSTLSLNFADCLRQLLKEDPSIGKRLGRYCDGKRVQFLLRFRVESSELRIALADAIELITSVPERFDQRQNENGTIQVIELTRLLEQGLVGTQTNEGSKLPETPARDIKSSVEFEQQNVRKTVDANLTKEAFDTLVKNARTEFEKLDAPSVEKFLDDVVTRHAAEIQTLKRFNKVSTKKLLTVLFELSEQFGLTQNEFAELFGKKSGYISQALKRDTPPKEEFASEIRHVFLVFLEKLQSN